MSPPPGGPATLGALARALRLRLAAAGIAEAALEARLLVAEACGCRPDDIVLDPDRQVTAAAPRLEALAARRLGGEPVGRILGRREFWGLDLALSPDTLEPRPDTETLVEATLAIARAAAPLGPMRIADLGTGSGAIAIALLHELPQAVVVATDFALGALATARANAARHGVADRLLPVRCDFGRALAGGFDLVVSNPPYIATAERADLAREVRDHDPPLALFGGPDGLDAYRAIVADLARLLRPGGSVLLEIGHAQAPAVQGLLAAAGLTKIEVRQDLGGRDRVVSAQCVAK